MKTETRLGLAAFPLLFAGVLYMATCSSSPADASPFDIRYRNPGAALAYDVLEVCNGDECRAYPVACAPGATCALVADLPTGAAEVSLVGRAGELASDRSNVRAVDVAAVEGCGWDTDADGAVTPADFGAFLVRFGAGELNSLDFAAFLRAFGQPCP